MPSMCARTVDIRSASPTTPVVDVRLRLCTLALLIAADGVFLWMFLSTDPLEQLAVAVRPTADASRQRALAFAAAWRHGMAGNSWIYMPGFFVTAAARCGCTARHAPEHLARTDPAGGLALRWSPRCGLSCRLPPRCRHLRAGIRSNGRLSAVGSTIPNAVTGWACSLASIRWPPGRCSSSRAVPRSFSRTLRPFAHGRCPGGRVAVRPWTVDDLSHHWSAVSRTGTPRRTVSLALLFHRGAAPGGVGAFSGATTTRAAAARSSTRRAPRTTSEAYAAHGNQIEARRSPAIHDTAPARSAGPQIRRAREAVGPSSDSSVGRDS